MTQTFSQLSKSYLPFRYFQHTIYNHFIPLVLWKTRGAYYLVHGDPQRQHPLHELPRGLLSLCRRTLGSERHRYAVAWPDKLGTDPIAYARYKCINRRRHGFSQSMEMSRLTRDGIAEPVSRDQILRRERGQGNIYSPCSADHEQDWQPYPVDLYSLSYIDM